jgi:hypothetical protein
VIDVTWLGGPHDGVTFELVGPAAFPLNFLDHDCYGDVEVLRFHERWFKPRWDGTKWVVPWWE